MHELRPCSGLLDKRSIALRDLLYLTKRLRYLSHSSPLNLAFSGNVFYKFIYLVDRIEDLRHALVRAVDQP